MESDSGAGNDDADELKELGWEECEKKNDQIDWMRQEVRGGKYGFLRLWFFVVF